MNRSRRIIAFVLFLCLFVSLVNPAQIVHAAEVSYRYELDTDGIDPGATYLIVNAKTAGSGNALMFYYASSSRRDLRNQTLTIKEEDGVSYISTGFSNEADCQFQFSSSYRGSITHGDYYLDLPNSRYGVGSSGTTLTFNHIGDGQYRIYYTSGYSTYYLRYSNDDWSSYRGSNLTTYSVYLFKLTEREVNYSVTFDGNGYTTGTLPENSTTLSRGDEYIIPEAKEALRKDVGEDTWLFLCWNTEPDGSGTEYHPGDKITIEGDLTLYADWYQQTKYTVSMITYLDGVATDVNKFAGYDRHFYAKLEGGDGSYITLTRQAEGTYSAKVVENGTYTIYAQTVDGAYEPVHGHNVVIYNQDGTTECLHYSVTYDANSGTWADGEAPAMEKHHYGEAVTAYDKVPTRAGYRFIGWQDQHGKRYSPSQLITESINEKLTLTAVWDDLITVTVNVVIDHNAKTTGQDNSSSMHDLVFSLLREENGANLLLEEKILTTGYVYDKDANTTTYQVVFRDMPKGEYHVASAKSNYETTITHKDDADGNREISINLQYAPENFDLVFDVVVNTDNAAEKELMPKAVNVKVSYWGYNEDDVLGWHIITQQDGDNAPTTIQIDENGKGSGFFPVWRHWSGSTQAYEYRLEVTSFILPDGSIVHASGNKEIYRPDGSGLYTATLSVTDGRLPTYPDGSNTNLSGAYFNGTQQAGKLTVSVDITPFTVTFNAGDGTVNGQKTITLENQYRYPNLHDYVATTDVDKHKFVYWTDENGNKVTDQGGQLLTQNVTYVAKYNNNITLTGTVKADASYLQDGQIVQIHEIDLVKTVLVVLQKKVGDVYNDIDSVKVQITYNEENGVYSMGMGNYEFTNLPNDGTEYRVQALVPNYKASYNNNKDSIFTEGEAVAQIDVDNAKAQVDILLDFVPDSYQQAIRINASQIHPDLRPTGALAQILYRDLGNAHHYQVISQHTVDPFGIKVDLDPATSTGVGYCDVWNWHTDGAPYEYQLQVSTLYGNNVTGAYDQTGTAYTQDSPFTIVYGRPNNYLQQELEGGVMLEATLVPKQYAINLDLNLGNDTSTPVVGLEDYHVDDGSGKERYAFMHTWSYVEQFTAYPYREGYVFTGWTSSNKDVEIIDGVIHIGDVLATDVTLTANWEPLTGTDYTIRYLELNTDKVLKGATRVSGAAEGYSVVAATVAPAIKGYVYAGAAIDGVYINKFDNPALTVSNNPKENLLVIYYLPDGSDGYTDQVESNLEINKSAVLENNGTYTITLDTYTKDNPITTLIQNNTPLDIVLVLDQSGSLAANNFAYLNGLQTAVNNFVESVANHGRQNEVDHRIAIVGYAGNESDSHSSNPVKATGGKESDTWINTGVFDSNGEYHLYNVNGFNYTKLNDISTIKADGIYYTKVTVDGQDRYLLLTHHNEYHHLITEEEARMEAISGTTVYGYVDGTFVKLTRNNSGLWLYGNRQLYSEQKFFTYHTDVWTHRDGLSPRQIHAYGVGASYTPVDGHEGVYTREETTGNSFEQNIYVDALMPVSVGAAGSGGTNPGLLKATQSLGADGATRASYGMEMANEILAANPVNDEDGRIRLVVMFTDGEPGYMGFDSSSGQQYYDQAVTEANNAIEQAYISKNTYNAYVYTIGLYESAGVEATSDVAYYMNALSSNYPNAHSMDDIKGAVTYTQAPNGTVLETNSNLFVKYDNTYYEIKYGYVRVNNSYRSQYCWYYTRNNTNYSISTSTYPAVDSNGMVGNYTIYQSVGGYLETEYSGYYATTESSDHLQDYFENILLDITTKITTKIVLESDTILRDIMNQGLVLTKNTVITVYTQEGNYNTTTKAIDWAVDENGQPILNKKISLDLSSGYTSAEGDSPGLDENGNPKPGVTIHAYNLDAANPTNPDPGADEAEYHPHTVDITGYDFHEWYISEKHTQGYKMVVTITCVEATDDVQWGRSTATNNEQSGLWLPKNAQGERQLLLPFEQPTTIFVERAYVLDYGKDFTLSGWYFDDEDGKDAKAVHVDCNIENGMNWFDPAAPNTKNSTDGVYGNTKYGNVNVDKENGTVSYSPTTMNWGGYDSFYVFGNTWRQTVCAQDANENGNLWNKVTVIPANNIYYEDSFTVDNSTGDSDQNSIEGFVFTGSWTIDGSDSGNTESPETVETGPNGGVHGWIEALSNDYTYTDGSAHVTGLNKEVNAKAEFTFTGTGVEVYTRTNADTGMVVAILRRVTLDSNGTQNTSIVKILARDNLAKSGDYYHIPTVAFRDLPYGTYTLQLTATATTAATENTRYVYYIDGVRILNPLGNTTNYQSDAVKDAYGLEANAVYTSIHNVLLDYGDFNPGLSDGTDGKMGAVFIDWIQSGQGSGDDSTGTGVPTYEIGTFKTLGPENEVYLGSGQAIVLKVDERNTYFVGLKSLTGKEVTVNLSGIDLDDPTAIKVSHTADMYYRVTPINGYIVIQNGSTDTDLDGDGVVDPVILAVTNLRTTNLNSPVSDGGILKVKPQEAVEVMNRFTSYMLEPEEDDPTPPPSEPEHIPSAEEQAQNNQQQATKLFTFIRQWLKSA